MTGLIDYAGLFPPAQLPFDEAISNYSAYQTDPMGWIVPRFILPASRINEIEKHSDKLFGDGKVARFSILGGASKSTKEFGTQLANCLEAIATLKLAHEKGADASVVELKLPENLLRTGTDWYSFLSETYHFVSTGHSGDIDVFLEAAFVDGWEELYERLSEAIAAQNITNREGVRFGLKLRCGGVQADMFPSCHQVAKVIQTCADYEVPMKATAGLHHPVRHFNDSVNTYMHGFFNVFGAAILSKVHGLEFDRILNIVEDQDAASFVFDDQGFSWKDLFADSDQIGIARRAFITSYGCCSFEEPLEDLASLNLI